jgi:hypothetical protein
MNRPTLEPAAAKSGRLGIGPPTTEAAARSLIEQQGFSNVSNLTQNPDGSWNCIASKDGASFSVGVDS